MNFPAKALQLQIPPSGFFYIMTRLIVFHFIHFLPDFDACGLQFSHCWKNLMTRMEKNEWEIYKEPFLHVD